MISFRKPSIFTFSQESLSQIARECSTKYKHNAPFPHVVLDDFLPRKAVDSLLKAFPKPGHSNWLDWRNRDLIHQPKKQGIGHAKNLETVSPCIHNMLFAFNSYPFLDFLEKLTGIKKLLPDPYFHGGGIHQILSGGKLAIHTDFNYLEELDIYRRINVLLYLNKNWNPGYNGNLELWLDKQCKKSISPEFNRLVVFNTSKNSFHGHPEPLNTPKNTTRKSLALYYYTSQPAKNETYDHKTDWLDD